MYIMHSGNIMAKLADSKNQAISGLAGLACSYGPTKMGTELRSLSKINMCFSIYSYFSLFQPASHLQIYIYLYS